jgi:hypothetical protein
MADNHLQTDFGNVAEELDDAKTFIDANVGAGIPREHVHEHLLASALSNVNKLGRASSRGATFLVEKTTNGPWSDGERTRLASAIMNAIRQDDSKAPPRNPKNKRLQRCLHFDQALTNAEWQGLRSKALRASKVDQMAHRAWSIGLIAPSEPTAFHIASALCLAEQITDPDTIEGVYGDAKAAINQLAQLKPYPTGTFPSTPRTCARFRKRSSATRTQTLQTGLWQHFCTV